MRRTGAERHLGRQFSISAKLIELAHGAMKWRDAFKTEAISTAARPPMYQCRHRPNFRPIYRREFPACTAALVRCKRCAPANTRLRGYLSWWGSDRRGHDQTAWHGAHHHGQRQHRAPTAGAGVGNALLRNTAELLTWRHCPATTTSASAIRRCCAALTRGSLFFLLVFLLVLLRFIANLHRRIQFPPAQFLISGHIRPSQKPPSPIGAGLFFALYRVTGHHGILCWSNFPGHLDRCNPPGRGI